MGRCGVERREKGKEKGRVRWRGEYGMGKGRAEDGKEQAMAKRTKLAKLCSPSCTYQQLQQRSLRRWRRSGRSRTCLYVDFILGEGTFDSLLGL